MRGPKDKGDRQRRFKEHYAANGVKPMNSHAIAIGRSIFYKKRVAAPDDRLHVLVSGYNNLKIGAVVDLGAWKGFPIYTLTLEERATCSVDCHHYRTCYGNSSSRAIRIEHGPRLITHLHLELFNLSCKHPHGFVVRLHVLGDFYDVGYVKHWERWLDTYPALHVYGFTQRKPGTPIGDAVLGLAARRWDRFAVRLSMAPGQTVPMDWYAPNRRIRAATTRDPSRPLSAGEFACPAQDDGDSCCATCGACWASAKTVNFKEHGWRSRATGE